MNWLIRLLLGSSGSGFAAGSGNSPKTGDESFSPERKLTFDETVAQMSRGYENTQRVIQFMDAKAGAVVALSLAIYAFAGKVAAWAYDKTDAVALKGLSCWVSGFAVGLGIAIVVCGFASLSYAFWTVRPNPLPSWGAFSTLFPAHGKHDEGKAKAYLKPVVTGADCGFAISEFERQLVAVGQIVHRKINWLRIAIYWLWGQGLASVVLGCLIGWLAISGKLVKSEASGKSPQNSVVVPISPSGADAVGSMALPVQSTGPGKAK